MVEFTQDGIVVVSYNNLVNDLANCKASIDLAFGSNPECLGLILVKDLPPSFAKLRLDLLHLAARFASMDESIREKYSQPSSRYSFGWSHGKEIMNGKPGLVLCKHLWQFHKPYTRTAANYDHEAFPEYYGSNIWPDNEEGLGEFKSSFEKLGQFILHVGLQLAGACQAFVSEQSIEQPIDLKSWISDSHTTKGRLLHYFPPTRGPETQGSEGITACGYHLDHSLITGLCSALYLSHSENQPPTKTAPPSASSGLYIKTRGGRLVKAAFPPDYLAFQTGEALEVATSGNLRATPHYVRVDLGCVNQSPVSRETFALFMQPNTDVMIQKDESFGQFSKSIFTKHYDFDAEEKQ